MDMGEGPDHTSPGEAGSYNRIFVNVGVIVEVNKLEVSGLAENREHEDCQKKTDDDQASGTSR
jgi:hypothetical protein